MVLFHLTLGELKPQVPKAPHFYRATLC